MRTTRSSSRRGVSTRHPPRTRHPLDQAPAPLDQTPRTRHPPDQPPPPLWTEWQTGVKILPCPKLRLRAVKIRTKSGFEPGVSYWLRLYGCHYTRVTWQWRMYHFLDWSVLNYYLTVISRRNARQRKINYFGRGRTTPGSPRSVNVCHYRQV